MAVAAIALCAFVGSQEQRGRAKKGHFGDTRVYTGVQRSETDIERRGSLRKGDGEEGLDFWGAKGGRKRTRRGGRERERERGRSVRGEERFVWEPR
jgi:hypothetical protein